MGLQDTVFTEKINEIFSPSSLSMVMGILNVTPDSFYDGGNHATEEKWLQHAEQMINEGLDIIDIGGYSTRPYAKHISAEEEEERVLQVITSVRKHFPEVLISIDTFRAAIARKAMDAGANIINDISGGTMDAAMYDTVARLQIPYILMHIQGTPKTMQQQPMYNDVVLEVKQYFIEKINLLNQLNVKQIIIDVGFGFGKTVEHNYTLLNHLEEFTTYGLPVLSGFSRKSMINKITDTKPEEALNGTTVLNTIALMKGSKILRVHDVKEAKEAMALVNCLRGK